MSGTPTAEGLFATIESNVASTSPWGASPQVRLPEAALPANPATTAEQPSAGGRDPISEGEILRLASMQAATAAAVLAATGQRGSRGGAGAWPGMAAGGSEAAQGAAGRERALGTLRSTSAAAAEAAAESYRQQQVQPAPRRSISDMEQQQLARLRASSGAGEEGAAGEAPSSVAAGAGGEEAGGSGLASIVVRSPVQPQAGPGVPAAGQLLAGQAAAAGQLLALQEAGGTGGLRASLYRLPVDGSTGSSIGTATGSVNAVEPQQHAQQQAAGDAPPAPGASEEHYKALFEQFLREKGLVPDASLVAAALGAGGGARQQAAGGGGARHGVAGMRPTSSMAALGGGSSGSGSGARTGLSPDHLHHPDGGASASGSPGARRAPTKGRNLTFTSGMAAPSTLGQHRLAGEQGPGSFSARQPSEADYSGGYHQPPSSFSARRPSEADHGGAYYGGGYAPWEGAVSSEQEFAAMHMQGGAPWAEHGGGPYSGGSYPAAGGLPPHGHGAYGEAGSQQHQLHAARGVPFGQYAADGGPFQLAPGGGSSGSGAYYLPHTSGGSGPGSAYGSASHSAQPSPRYAPGPGPIWAQEEWERGHAGPGPGVGPGGYPGAHVRGGGYGYGGPPGGSYAPEGAGPGLQSRGSGALYGPPPPGSYSPLPGTGPAIPSGLRRQPSAGSSYSAASVGTARLAAAGRQGSDGRELVETLEGMRSRAESPPPGARSSLEVDGAGRCVGGGAGDGSYYTMQAGCMCSSPAIPLFMKDLRTLLPARLRPCITPPPAPQLQVGYDGRSAAQGAQPLPQPLPLPPQPPQQPASQHQHRRSRRHRRRRRHGRRRAEQRAGAGWWRARRVAAPCGYPGAPALCCSRQRQRRGRRPPARAAQRNPNLPEKRGSGGAGRQLGRQQPARRQGLAPAAAGPWVPRVGRLGPGGQRRRLRAILLFPLPPSAAAAAAAALHPFWPGGNAAGPRGLLGGGRAGGRGVPGRQPGRVALQQLHGGFRAPAERGGIRRPAAPAAGAVWAGPRALGGPRHAHAAAAAPPLPAAIPAAAPAPTVRLRLRAPRWLSGYPGASAVHARPPARAQPPAAAAGGVGRRRPAAPADPSWLGRQQQRPLQPCYGTPGQWVPAWQRPAHGAQPWQRTLQGPVGWVLAGHGGRGPGRLPFPLLCTPLSQCVMPAACNPSPPFHTHPPFPAPPPNPPCRRARAEGSSSTCRCGRRRGSALVPPAAACSSRSPRSP